MKKEPIKIEIRRDIHWYKMCNDFHFNIVCNFELRQTHLQRDLIELFNYNLFNFNYVKDPMLSTKDTEMNEKGSLFFRSS